LVVPCCLNFQGLILYTLFRILSENFEAFSLQFDSVMNGRTSHVPLLLKASAVVKLKFIEDLSLNFQRFLDLVLFYIAVDQVSMPDEVEIDLESAFLKFRPQNLVGFGKHDIFLQLIFEFSKYLQ
jgi:hypothetical protein